MLKSDDLPWTDLVVELGSVVSHRYVEDPAALCSPFYMPVEEEPGFAFASLNREDRMELLAELVDWRHYECQGICHAQQAIVVANVLDGKPQHKWLEGVFDQAVLDNQRIAGFKASVEDRENSPDNHVFEEMNGDRLPWADLSAAAKLQYIALDAVRNDVPFEPFAVVVRETIGEVGEAALRVVLDGQKELRAIAELFPDDGRTEPTSLVDQVKEMLEYISALETQEDKRLLPPPVTERDSEWLNADTPDPYEETGLTAEELAALFKEIREDEAAGKLPDAHGTYEQRKAWRTFHEEKAKATQGKIADARGGPGEGTEQESHGVTLSLDDLRADAKQRSEPKERDKEQGKETDRGNRGR